MSRMSPRRWRVLIFGSLALAMLCFVTLGVLYALERRATIEVDLALAQPFLALDADADVHKEYGSPPGDGLGSEIGSVHVVFATDKPDAMVEQIKSVMIDEGWTPTGDHAMEWHSGTRGYRWGRIFVEDNEVRLFIGVIEG